MPEVDNLAILETLMRADLTEWCLACLETFSRPPEATGYRQKRI